MKIKMKQNNRIVIFFSEIFGNLQFFVEKKNFFPSLQKSPNPNPNLKKIPKSPNKNLNLPIQIQSIYLLFFHYNLIQLHCTNISVSLTSLLPQKSPPPKSKNYRKTLRNYRISITKMLQFCPGFGASLPSSTPRQPFLATFLGF